MTVTGTLTVDGAITADGADGVIGLPDYIPKQDGGGGGSGGSVYLNVGTLKGSGIISANGGGGWRGVGYASLCGAGGGGRAAVYTCKNSYYGLVSADGGEGYEPGEEGTIVFGQCQETDSGLSAAAAN